jgi:dynein heavy chain
MTEIIGFDITPNAGTTLRKMLRLNLAPFMTQFEGISIGASKVSFIRC